MHNKAFLITQEIPRCQQHRDRDLIRFLLCVQLNPVETKGESARLTAPKNLLPRHREGWRRVEGGPEDQAENVQDTLYHTHLPCGTPDVSTFQRPEEGGEAEITAADRVRTTPQALQRGIVLLPSLHTMEAV